MSKNYGWFFYRLFFSLLLLSSVPCSVNAQQIKTITTINNQRNIDFNCMLQDNNGIIWFGTNKGLIKFDGEKYKIYEVPRGIINEPISAIFEDAEHTLWLGHSNGKITLFKNETFSSFKWNNLLGNKPISAFTQFQGIWIGTYGLGIYYFDTNTIKHLSTENGLNDDIIYTLCKDHKNNIWAGTDGGLISVKYISMKWITKVVSMKKGLPDNIVRKITLASNDELMVAMQDSGICAYNTESEKFKTYKNWHFGTVNSILEFEPNVFYLAVQNKGVYKCVVSGSKLGNASRLAYTEDVDCKELQQLFKDRENNLWFIKKNSLALLSQSRWKLFQARNGLLADTILGVLIDSKNNCWIASSKGLQRYEIPSAFEAMPTHLIHKETIYNKEVTCLFEDHKGNIWFGTYGHGLYKYHLKSRKLSAIPLQTGEENDNVSCITNDSQNKIWVATLGGGISVIENVDGNENVKNFGINEGLSANYIYSILCDSEFLRWIGTDGNGLVEYTAGIFIKVNEKSHIDGKSVYSIIKSNTGNVWFNMSENGLYRFDKKSIVNFNTKNGLSDNNPLSIASYKDQILSVHGGGIDVFNEKTNEFKYYYFNEIDVEPNLNAIFTDKKGNVWIGTNKGLILFRSSEYTSDTITPLVSFNNLLVQNKEYSLSASPNFSSSQNNLVFNFNAVWCRIGDKVRFKYKLLGVDKKYLITDNKFASYSGLQPGKYTFNVAAANGEGQWSKPIQYSFTIDKPLWQQWWIWLLSFAIIYITVHVVLKYRLNMLKREKRILEHKVQLRTQEIVNQSKIIEAKNKDITDSIEYAKKIQDSILPPLESIKLALPQSFIFYNQKDIVSGDFYWFVQKSDVIIIAAVDCTGHGVPGAFMSLIGNNILNQIVNEKNITDPRLILQHLNDGVLKALYSNKTYSAAKDGMDIGICAIRNNNKNLVYAGAMRPLFHVRNQMLNEINGDKVPIGTDFNSGIHKDFKFENKEIEVLPGDTFYLTTDGYADQFGGEKGKKMMKKNFKNLLEQISNDSMESQFNTVKEGFLDWKGTYEQVDDVLVIGFRL